MKLISCKDLLGENVTAIDWGTNVAFVSGQPVNSSIAAPSHGMRSYLDGPEWLLDLFSLSDS
jgi:hypothetical protein